MEAPYVNEIVINFNLTLVDACNGTDIGVDGCFWDYQKCHGTSDIGARCLPSAFPFAIRRFWFDATFKAAGMSEVFWSALASAIARGGPAIAAFQSGRLSISLS